ncbi:MAG: DNA repair protein RecO [Christensenellales bacterium]
MFNETALVLRYADYGDNSRMLTMMTPSLGVISAAAHGCRKTGGKMTYCVQPFTYGEYALSKKGDRYTVTQGDVKESFTNISRSLQRFAAAVFFLDVCAELTPRDNPAQDMFALVLFGLYLFDSAQTQTEGILVYLLYRLFAICGYGPHLSSCVVCGKELDEPHFQMKLGGIACAACGGIPMSHSAWRTLLAIEQIDPKKAFGIRLEPWLAKELLELLSGHLQQCCGHAFDTYAYFCRMPKE